MQLSLYAPGLPASRPLAEHAERSLRASIDHLAGDIDEAVVRLRDVNGPRKGVDKDCLVRVFLRSGDEVLVRERSDCVYAAIDGAATRLKKVVGRRIAKARCRRRRQQRRRAA